MASTPPMDDRHAQFLIVVADACVGAELAKLVVEVVTIDGARYCGVPTTVDIDQAEIANGCTLRVDGSVVALKEVAEFVVRLPGEAPGLH